MQDQDWMQLAINLAHKSLALDEVPVGALIVATSKQQPRIIGEGYNRQISSNDATAHAEIMAIRNATKTTSNYRLIDCTLYTTLEPCTMCLGAIVHSRINTIVFACTEPKSGAIISNPQAINANFFNHKFQIRTGVLEAEAKLLMQNFFKAKRN